MIIVIIFLCVIPFSYLIIYRFGDYYICPYIIAKKTGVAPNYLAIREYITEILSPGISRNEVEEKLGNLGKIKIWHGDQIFDYSITDQIRLNYCSHPANAITIFANYSLNNQLNWIRIDTGE
jgi:hypothetical protein